MTESVARVPGFRISWAALRAIRAGFDLHLAKPVTADGLLETVDDLCQVATAQAPDTTGQRRTAKDS